MVEPTEDMNKTERTEQIGQEILELRSAVLREYAPMPDVASEWERLCQDIEIDTGANQKMFRNTIVWRSLLGIAASAAVLLAFFFLTHAPKQTTPVVFSATPTAKDVILDVGNGDKRIIKNPVVSFRQSATESSAQMLTLITPRGKDSQAILPDGTKVWMNADSKLIFPKIFPKNKRIVTLQGEAYFEVVKERRRQFEVRTNFFTTIVHGTTFNLRAYSAENANLVLIDGSVTIDIGKESRTIKPGEMAFWKRNGSLTVTEVDTYSYIQRRNGFFYFDNQPLFEIMQELGRWYNVNIMFDDPEKMKIRLHFVAKRKDSLKEVIKNMNELGAVHIEQEHGTVVIR